MAKCKHVKLIAQLKREIKNLKLKSTVAENEIKRRDCTIRIMQHDLNFLKYYIRTNVDSGESASDREE